MCGISGIVLSSASRRELTPRIAERMRDILSHRGPDDFGMFLEEGVALGHRRLSIVDVNAGHQPMSNEDGNLQIVYNGEIYNHTDYRGDLESLGHVYRTHCDTETILHLYEEDGARCVEKLRGMFAFAIWNRRRKELFVARDRLGVKPLYYVHTSDGSLYFGSEIKALLAAGAVKPELNFAALPDYLANHAPSGEETLFAGVKRLLPGHVMTWRDGNLKIDKYWDVQFAREEVSLSSRSDKDLVAEWLELFKASVRLRLMADVPLGMFLSGGIDSSAIAAMMSEMVAEPIKTFSVAFKEREANELEYARLVARAFNTDHHETLVSPEAFFEALPRLVWHEDEPVAHPSSVALYFVSKLASEHVKVVLTGEGSDEMLAGYGRYRKTVYNLAAGATYYRFTNEPLRKLVGSSVSMLPKGSTARGKLMRSFLCVRPEIESIYFDNFAVFSRGMQRELFTGELKERIDGVEPFACITKYLEQTDADTLLNKLLYADIKTYLHELLMKQDQMSMAASIESRVPFLDHKLVEFTARLPERMKLRGLTTKYILRESMKGRLPDAILNRSKMGFPVPVGSWFRGAYRSVVDDHLLSKRAMSRGLFDPAVVRQLVEEHQAGLANHAERLWSLVNLEIWMRQFIDGETSGDFRTGREAELAAS
jgi:asparagine synthase (glutamine-hydrolysing)